MPNSFLHFLMLSGFAVLLITMSRLSGPCLAQAMAFYLTQDIIFPNQNIFSPDGPTRFNSSINLSSLISSHFPSS